MPRHASKETKAIRTVGSRGLMIVAGDWVVDEYWLLVRHRSRISSHTGFTHYRIATDGADEIKDLCGAGHIARVLCHLNQDSHYQLLGLGAWNEKDASLISHLLHARGNLFCHANSPGFQILPEYCDLAVTEMGLYTLAPDGPTTRVVRQYHREYDGIEQINRIDWEAPMKTNPTIPIASLALPHIKKDRKVVIAVNDLDKGVVTPQAVQELLDIYPEAVWCVRSKAKNPDWLSLIADERLSLLVLGPETAERLNPWGSWITHRTVSSQALEVLEGLRGLNVALISGDREIVARFGLDGDCVTAHSRSELSPLNDLGFPTAVFAVLADRVFRSSKPILGESDLETAIHTAEHVAGVPIAQGLRPPVIKSPDIHTVAWSRERQAWEMSRSGMGILQKPDGYHLEVWRACTALTGYVACIKKKEEIISEIGRALRAFRRNPPQHSNLSIFIQADPGAGKTHLAKSLADAFEFSFTRFDITQMLHRDDLLELFDSVATKQANARDDLLVFVDEINASLDGSPVYGAFLSPLEEGYYVRRGSRFSLRPCVWIFVGTDPGDQSIRKEKLSDFESRMTIVRRIDYEGLRVEYAQESKKLEDEARLEQVYLGAIMIRRLYPDVIKVSEAVLRQFYLLDPSESPARRIRRLCGALRDVRRGMVSRRNCEEWGDMPWEKGGRKAFVHLDF